MILPDYAAEKSNPFAACIMQGGIKYFCCKMQRVVKFGNGESNKKSFKRLPRPLKVQSCKKSHTGVLHYPIPMRTILKTLQISILGLLSAA